MTVETCFLEPPEVVNGVKKIWNDKHSMGISFGEEVIALDYVHEGGRREIYGMVIGEKEIKAVSWDGPVEPHAKTIKETVVYVRELVQNQDSNII